MVDSADTIGYHEGEQAGKLDGNKCGILGVCCRMGDGGCCS